VGGLLCRVRGNEISFFFFFKYTFPQISNISSFLEIFPTHCNVRARFMCKQTDDVTMTRHVNCKHHLCKPLFSYSLYRLNPHNSY